MRPAQKATLRAGLIVHLENEVRRHTRVLGYHREAWHRARRPRTIQDLGNLDPASYQDIVKAQIIVLRRARLTLEAVQLAARAEGYVYPWLDERGVRPKEKRSRCRRPAGHNGMCLPEPTAMDDMGTKMLPAGSVEDCGRLIIPAEEYRDNEERRRYLYRLEEEGPDCPVNDPDCLGGDEDCHDACEPPDDPIVVAAASYDDPYGLEEPDTPEEIAEQKELDRTGRAGL